MKPEPIYINPGTFTIAGTAVERHIHDLEQHIERLQSILGAELKQALGGMGESIQNDTSALIRFTGAFTGMSTLLNFCSFTRGIIALEKGMETQADRKLVERVRGILVPLVSNQCEILKTSINAHLDVKDASLLTWYETALEAVQGINGYIARLG